MADARKQEGLFYRLYLDENAEYFGNVPRYVISEEKIGSDADFSIGGDVVLYFARYVGVGAILHLLGVPRRDIFLRIRTPRNHLPSRPTTRRQTRPTRPKIPRHRLPNSRKSRSLRNPNPSPPRRSIVLPPSPTSHFPQKLTCAALQLQQTGVYPTPCVCRVFALQVLQHSLHTKLSA